MEQHGLFERDGNVGIDGAYNGYNHMHVPDLPPPNLKHLADLHILIIDINALQKEKLALALVQKVRFKLLCLNVELPSFFANFACTFGLCRAMSLP